MDKADQVTPVPMPNGTAVEANEGQKLWQEYLQKCCEVGQLDHALAQIESQKLQIEKNLEVTQRQVKSLAEKHKEYQMKVQATPVPKADAKLAEAQAH
jgi:hypothetical protein